MWREMDTEAMKRKSLLLDCWVFRLCIVNLSLWSSETSNISPRLVSNRVPQFLLCNYPSTTVIQQNPVTVLWTSSSESISYLLILVLLPGTFLYAKYILHFMTKLNSFMNYFLTLTVKGIFLSPSTSIAHYYYYYYY